MSALYSFIKYFFIYNFIQYNADSKIHIRLFFTSLSVNNGFVYFFPP